MRIIVGGFEHETNSFSNICADTAEVKRLTRAGENYIRSNMGIRCTMGGIIDECRELGIQLLAASRIYQTPCGPTRKEAFEAFRDEFIDLVWAAHCEEPLDAVIMNIRTLAKQKSLQFFLCAKNGSVNINRVMISIYIIKTNG
jgi:microcystin degradation protein MlrC